MKEENKHLYYLDELTDYKVADGYSDIRDWDVKDKDNRVIGKVKNLLVSTEAERVVYLDVKVDKSIIDAKYDPYTHPANPEVREFINKDGENHIIIPVGLVDINSDGKYVYTESVDHQTFAETKRYEPGTLIDRDYEIAVLDSYHRNDDYDHLRENKLRAIIREELREQDYTNYKAFEFENESRIRHIVRHELYNVLSDKEGFSKEDFGLNEPSMASNNIGDTTYKERLAHKRARLHRDNFRDNEGSFDVDHDKDGNPNITDPDYYEKKAKDIKDTDYDHDKDGNPNVTDPDFYGSRSKRKDRHYKKDGRHFYERREFDNDQIEKNRED